MWIYRTCIQDIQCSAVTFETLLSIYVTFVTLAESVDSVLSP